MIVADGWEDRTFFDEHCRSPEVKGKYIKLYKKDIASNIYEI
jgi:quinol monooxygenase YgiN